MAFDMYLHVWSGKRNLLLSFFPTTVMLSSVGFTIIFSPMDISYVFHYVLFGCLLFVVLIDYEYVLKGIKAPMFSHKKELVATKMTQKEPATIRTKSLFIKKTKPSQQLVTPLIAENIIELKKVSDTVLQKMQIIVDDLDRKTVRIEKLEEEFEAQKNLIRHEKMSTALDISSLESKEKIHVNEENFIRNIPTKDKIILKEKIENHLVIDEMNDIVAVVQRGIFKEISNSFADFLGYERTELLQKNFFVFISPRGFEDARKYYLNRLKGVTANTFRTVLLTKERSELLVEVTVTSTVYKGDSAEFLTVNEVKNNS